MLQIQRIVSVNAINCFALVNADVPQVLLKYTNTCLGPGIIDLAKAIISCPVYSDLYKTGLP